MRNKKYLLLILLFIAVFIYLKASRSKVITIPQKNIQAHFNKETQNEQQSAQESQELVKMQNCEEQINIMYSARKYDASYLENFFSKFDSEMTNFISINWNDFYKKPQAVQPTSTYGMFFQAVAFSGELSTTENKAVEVQLEKSILSYKKVIEIDPKNSYPYYYLASALIRAKKYEEASYYLLKALKEPQYSSYMNDISQKIYMFSLEEPKAYFQGTLFYSSMPTPNPKSLGNIISFMPKAAEDLGKKMTRAAKKYKDAPPRFWSQLEHEYGRKILKETFSKEFYNTLEYKEYYKTPSQDIDREVFSSENCTQRIPSYIKKLKQEIQDLTEI